MKAKNNQRSDFNDRRVLVDVVIPVLNEEKVLNNNVLKVRGYLLNIFPCHFRIIIIDNGSTDNTERIGQNLAKKYPEIKFEKLTERGRGRALKHAWLQSKAEILSYMDVDLSTDLNAFQPLLEPLLKKESALSIGNRLLKNSHTKRSLHREIVSRVYNKIIHFYFKTSFSDAQCGFKAIRKDIAQFLLPQIKDNDWFFDTELLIKADHAGLNIHEEPIKWTEDHDSRVKIVRTSLEDLRGLFRVKKELR